MNVTKTGQGASAYFREEKLVVDVTTLKMARKQVKLQKENPAGCAEEKARL